MAEYIAVIHKDEESDYGVFFPDVPGCFSAGSDLEEARVMAADALACHLAMLIDDGHDIPLPSTLDEAKNAEGAEDAVAFFAVKVNPNKPKVIRKNITALNTEWDAIDEAAQAIGKTRSAYIVEAAIEKAQAKA